MNTIRNTRRMIATVIAILVISISIHASDHPGNLTLKSIVMTESNSGMKPGDQVLIILFPEALGDSLQTEFANVFDSIKPGKDFNFQRANFWAFTTPVDGKAITEVSDKNADFIFPDKITHLSVFAVPLTGTFAFSPEEIDEVINTERNSSTEISGFRWRQSPDDDDTKRLNINLRFKWKKGIPPVFDFPVLSEKELFITDPDVIESDRATKKDGAWHFSTTMRRLQGGGNNQEVSAFTLHWLRSWINDSNLNDDPEHTPRPAINNIINDWIANSPGGENDLNWEKAPFRLTAIVNRIDLTKLANVATIEPSKLGEARLVYGLADGGLFNVIFEYHIPGPVTSDNLTDWARQWRSLAKIGAADQFPEAYLMALQAITDQYTQQDHISQVRTNEVAISSLWEMREFVLNTAQDALIPNLVALNPQQRFASNAPQFQATLKNFLVNNAAAIKDGTLQSVPLNVGSEPFAGAVSQTPSSSFTWKNFKPANGVSDHVIANFSLNTCNGCHGGDGPGVSFVHVQNAISQNQADILSDFLLKPQTRFLPDGTTEQKHEMEGRGIMQIRFAVGSIGAPLTESTMTNDFQKEVQFRANRPH